MEVDEDRKANEEQNKKGKRGKVKRNETQNPNAF